MNESPICIKLLPEEKVVPETLARSLTAPHQEMVRAKTLLLLAEDYTVSDAARQVGRQRRIVRKGAWRFLDQRLQGLMDAPRSGRPPRLSPRSGSAPDQAGLRAA